MRNGGCEDFCARLTSNGAFTLWLRAPAVPLTVRLTLANPAEALAVTVTFCCPPVFTLNEEGEAVTPLGNPLIVTLIAPAFPLAITTMLDDEPCVTITVEGCTAKEKAGGGGGGGGPPEFDPPPPQPASITKEIITSTKKDARSLLIILTLL